MSLPLRSPRANVRNAPRPKAKYKFRDEHSQQKLNAADIARVTEALARGEKPDPIDPDDRQAVEAHFDSIAGALAEFPPEDRAVAEDLYIQQTGVLPTPVKNALLGGLLSAAAAAQVAAARRLAQLEDTDPLWFGTSQRPLPRGARTVAKRRPRSR